VPGFVDALRAGPIVLDGGLATELERRGADLSSALWSARLLVDDPAAILAAHRAFFAAGAQVAISASYQASSAGFAALGVDGKAMLRRSVELARAATDGVADRWVAASVGPYGATLADGSEYRGDYRLSVGELRRFHRPRIAELASAGADVLAVETIPGLAEAEALLAEVDAIGAPAWLSMSCTGTRTRAGEPASEAFAMARGCAAVVAVGVNCVDPADAAGLIELACSASGKPAVVYPNSGETWDAGLRCWTGDPGFDPEEVRAWIDAGARLVGGCCRVTPMDIRRLRSSVSRLADPLRQL
jgi:homocysteine S-methyltransferase